LSDEKLKISVCGVGRLGKLHAKLLKEVENAELIGVFDTDAEKKLKVAEELNCLALEHWEEVLIRSQAVIIVTPTTTHADLALDAIYQNRHVFVEKPISDNSEDAREMVEAAGTVGVKLQVGHIERFNPAVLAVKDVDLKPRFIEVHRLAAFDPRGTDVAVVKDLMIHDLDLILKFVDSPVKEIRAVGVEVVSGDVDIANVRLEFESECVANVTASRLSAKKMRKMRIFQDEGYVSLDFLTGQAEIFKLSDKDEGPGAFVLGAIDKGVHRRNIVYLKPDAPQVNALLEEQKAFVNSVLNDKPVVVSGADALKALELSEAILQNMEKESR